MTTQTAAPRVPLQRSTWSSRPSTTASSTSTRSLFSRISSGWHSGVAEADVELEHLAALVGDHQPGIEHARNGRPSRRHGVDGGHG